MSTQSVPRQFPVPLNLPGHASARPGPVPVDRAHGLAVPKVGLSEICLSYRTQSGERLLALEGINLDVVGYDRSALTVVTWGRLQELTWSFWDRYVDEVYAVLSVDFLDETGQAPNGFELAALKKDLALVTA